MRSMLLSVLSLSAVAETHINAVSSAVNLTIDMTAPQSHTSRQLHGVAIDTYVRF